MTYSNVFYLTEFELDELDFTRFHQQCNPVRYRSLKPFLSEMGQIELNVAGLISLPPDELIPNALYRAYVRQLVREWPCYWMFLRLDPPFVLYHLAAQCDHVLILKSDSDGSYRFSISALEIAALILSQYSPATAEAAICGAPWAVVVGRLWDVLSSFNIRLFSVVELCEAIDHPMPYAHLPTREEIQQLDTSRIKWLFAAATQDRKTAGVMRGSIQIRFNECSETISTPLLKMWAKKVLTEHPECVFLLTTDDRGILSLLQLVIPRNDDLNRVEPTELFHLLASNFVRLCELEKLIGNSDLLAVERLREIFRKLGFGFCS